MKNKKLLYIFLITIFIVFLLVPSAFARIPDLDEDARNTALKIRITYSNWSDSRLYCMNHDYTFYNGGDYLLNYYFEFTDDDKMISYSRRSGSNVMEKGNEYKSDSPVYRHYAALAYIGYMANTESSDRKNDLMNPNSADKYQKAMWGLLAHAGDTFGSGFFHGEGIKNEDKNFENDSSCGELCKKAIAIFEGEEEFKPIGKMGKYSYQGRDTKQSFLIVDVYNKNGESPEVKLKLKKINSISGKGVSNVGFSVTAGENVGEIKGLSSCTVNSTTWNGLKSSNDGNLGTLNIKPKNNTGTFKIKIKEEYAPNSYEKLSDEITLTVKYNTNTGSVTSVAPDKHSDKMSYDNNTATLSIKNDVEPGKLVIQKKFEGDAKDYSKVKFTIEITNDTGVKIAGKGTVVGNTVIAEDVTPDTNGKIEITNIKKSIHVKIIETDTADGYIPMIGDAEYDYSPNDNYDTWNFTGSDNSCCSKSIKNGSGTITITNKENPKKTIVLRKVDLEGNPLSNIKFKLNVNLGRICMIGDNIYVDGKLEDYISNNGSGQKVMKFPDGEKTVTGENKVTVSGRQRTIHADGDKDGKVYISEAITDSEGKITVEVLDYYPIGDVNLDGKITAADARLILRFATGGEKPKNDNICTLADINQDGYICSEEEFIRDVNLDGKVTAADARLVLRAAASLENLTEFQSYLADVNCDGRITAEDSRLLLRIAAKLGLDAEKLNEDNFNDNGKELVVSNSVYDIEKHGCIDCEDPDEFKDTFVDADYCLNCSAQLSKIGYSLITIKAEESDNNLYEKLNETKSFYYIDNMAICSDKEHNEIKTKINEYVEKLSSLTCKEINEKSGENYNAYIKVLDELKSKSTSDSDVVMEVVNTPKPWPLTIQKYDPTGKKKLGAGYEFTITIDNAYKFELDKKYLKGYSSNGNGTVTVEGNTINVVTDSNGEIKIKNVWAKSVDSSIIAKETKVAINLFKNIPETTVTKTTDKDGNVKFTSKNEDAIKIDNGNIKILECPESLVLDLSKMSSDEKPISKANFDVTIKTKNKTIAETKSYVTDDNGKIKIENIDIGEYLGEEITVILEETSVPQPYVLPADASVSIVFKYEAGKHNSCNKDYLHYCITKKSGVILKEANFKENELDVTLINGLALPDIYLHKSSYLEKEPVKDAKFTIVSEGINFDRYYSDPENKTIITDSEGNIYLNGLEPLNTSGVSTIKITIEEIETKAGLKLLSSPIEISYKYNPSTGEISGESDKKPDGVTIEYSKDRRRFDINAIDYNVIEELKLHKTDSVTGASLPNTEFTLDFGDKVKELKVHKDCVTSNYSSGSIVGDYYLVTGSKVNCKTNSNGEILLKDIVITEKNVTCTVTETKAPSGKDENKDGVIDYYYKELDRIVSFNITYGTFGKTRNEALTVETPTSKDGKITVGSVTKNVEDLAETTSTNYDVTFNLKNVPLIDLSGQVWLDGQWGSKNVSSPDGNKGNGDKGVNDILVQLYKDEDTNTAINHTYTNESANNGVMLNPHNGADLQGDHINDPESETRHFDNLDAAGYYSFKGIEYRGGKSGYIIRFEYNGVEYQAVQGGVSKASELDRSGFNNKFTTINNNGANNSIKLEYAHSENGDIADLKGEINGYNPATGNKDFTIYSQTDKYCATTHNLDFGIKQRFFDLRLSNIEDSIKLTINDKETTYTFDEIERQEQNGNSQDNPQLTFPFDISDYNYRVDDYDDFPIKNYDVSTGETDDNDLTEIINNEKDKNKQLRAFITYEINIIPQADENGNTSKVNKISYEYDKHLENMKIQKKDNNGNFVDFNDYDLTNTREGYAEIEFNGGLDVSGDNGQTLYITFEIKRDNDGGLPDEIATSGGLNVATIAEILEYTTTKGLIDNDSCPGNHSAEPKEDDTDDGEGIKIIITNNERTITGTVWDDENKDGQLDEGKGINDVIVQLIEIKEYNGSRKEYIWQEMRTGSKKIKKSGSEEEQDIGEELGAGEYKFTGFIPGNYIIRYIYGDGRTYDVTPNVEKYNGQDYQSTKDLKYQEQWYNNSGYEESNSIARDNEARRLTVMAFSTEIDGKLGSALSALNKDYNELTNNEKQQLTNYWNESFDGIGAYRYNIIEMNDEIAEEDFSESLSDLDETHFEILKYYILQKTWMCAETSLINIPVDTEDKSIIESSTTVSFKIEDNSQILDNMNFGLKQRPQTRLELEKHITGLKITPTGTGVQPIVDAKINIEDVLNDTMNVTGIKEGLSEIKATRDERGYWKVETDIEELIQGAKLEVTYTYVIKNISDEDYLNENLVNKYKTDEIEDYIIFLSDKSKELKTTTKGNTHTYGTFLGQYYYNQEKAASDAEVLSRVELIEECLNNDLDFVETTADTGFDKRTDISNVTKKVYSTDGELEDITIKTIIQSKNPTSSLERLQADYSKNILLTTTLSSSNKEISYPSYIAEIVKYSNAAGRRDVDSVPENLNYVHSNNTEFTLNTYYDKTTNKYYQEGNGSIYENDIANSNEFVKTDLSSIPSSAIRLNEMDEFWAERIMVTKPTGEDKQEPVTIAIITISSIAVLGVGIVLIKKFVLKK